MNAAAKLEAALAYARHGMFVLPVWGIVDGHCACPKGSKCDQKPGKHPLGALVPHGLIQATTDADTITKWWTRYPEANIGLALEPSGLIAFDVDTPAGYETLAAIERDHGELETARQRSGSGAHHILAKRPAFKVRGDYGGITMRGANYIVVAPSTHKSGGIYEWERAPWECEPISLPESLAEKLKRKQSSTAAKPRTVPLNNEIMVKRARAWLAKAEPAVEGQHGEASLMRVCCKLVHGFELTDSDALSAILLEYNPRCVPPWGDDEIHEIERKIDEARLKCDDPAKFRVEDREPPRPSTSSTRVTEGGVTRVVAGAGYGEHGGYRLTEIGNARRLVDAHGSGLRYVATWKSWLAWDGRRWKRDDTGTAHRAAKAVAASLYADVAALSMRASVAINGGEQWGGAPLEEMQKWARTSSRHSSINAMLSLAATENEIAATTDVWNADEFLLNVANGTVDLRDGELRPHRQQDMITRIAAADYDPHATAPQWEAFLERVLPDREVRDWVQRFLGYSLTGDVREQCLAFFVGVGANGKSVLLDVVLRILGEYGLRAAPDLVLASHSERHPTEVVDLDGPRTVVCSEIEQGRMWSEATIKRVTGDATIKARGMRQDFYEFKATGKIIVAANTRPTVRGTDDGIWRRMRIVPWTVRIPDGEQDKELPAKLYATEASGILAWLVRGCLAWQRSGLGTAKAIDEATKGYRDDQDVLGQWIEDRCSVGPDLWQATSSLYANYQTWCEGEGIEPWSRRAWHDRLTERRGIKDGKRGPRSEIRALIGLAVRGAP